MVSVGFVLQPEARFLDLLEGVIAEADHAEVAPETLWRLAGDDLVPNGFFHRFAALAAAGKPFVAHGVGFSVGSADAAAHQARWLARVREDHETFRFRWWTDHLGAVVSGGEVHQLPLPLPMTDEAAAIVRGALARMAEVVGDVGVENTAQYFVLGDPLDEPAFLHACAEKAWLLLDLHNVVVMARNLGFDARAYVDRLDLTRVIEIHVSGGSESDPRWSPSGRRLRLDSHAGAVPDEVWALLDHVRPRCTRLRGLTLERMEGTVGPDDVATIAAELRRLRAYA